VVILVRSIPGSRDAPCRETESRYLESKRLQSSNRTRFAFSLLSTCFEPTADCCRPCRYKNYSGVDASTRDAVEPLDEPRLKPILCSAALTSKPPQIHRLTLFRLLNSLQEREVTISLVAIARLFMHGCYPGRYLRWK
jgi:hypothetical protein